MSPSALQSSFDDYNRAAETKSDPFNKRFFPNTPLTVDDTFNVAIVGSSHLAQLAWLPRCCQQILICVNAFMAGPVVHYTMGGVSGDEHGRVIRADGSVIPGLYTAGECLGGVHGKLALCFVQICVTCSECPV